MNILYGAIGVIVIIGSVFLYSYFQYARKRRNVRTKVQGFDGPNTILGTPTHNNEKRGRFFM